MAKFGIIYLPRTMKFDLVILKLSPLFFTLFRNFQISNFFESLWKFSTICISDCQDFIRRVLITDWLKIIAMNIFTMGLRGLYQMRTIILFGYDAVFYRTYPLLYHKYGNIVIFRPRNLHSLCSPGNQHYQKII